MSQPLSSCSVDELGEFLLDKGIPGDIVLTFSENQIDGESFLDLTESDVKELVKPLGVVKKIVRLLREVTSTPPASQASEDTVLNISTTATPPAQSPSLFSSAAPSPSPSHASTVSVCNSSSVSGSSASLDSSGFPLNFTVPNKWRPSIMFAIEENKLTPDVRSEVVRDLVTHMYGYTEKPSSSFCKFVAQRLILQYKFMRDSKGTGYGSWEKKLIERVSNIQRKRKAESEPANASARKKGRPKKLAVTLEDRYPALSQEDTTNEDEKSAYEALRKEMAISKPQKNIFLPLMKSTFSLRRHYILHDALSVKDILKDYPALKQAECIEQEMEIILSRPGVLNTFMNEWQKKWVPAVVEYCKALKRKDIGELVAKQDSSE